MSPKAMYFILLTTLSQCCQGSAQQDLLRYIHDLREDIRDNFKRFETEIRHLKNLNKLKNFERIEEEIRKLKKENKVLREELGYMKSSMHNDSRKCDQIIEAVIKDKRGITPYGTIAFSAVLTPNFDKRIGTKHVFVYDNVESNIGGSYNSNTGIFMAPRPGTYAFLWTIFTEGRYDLDGQFGEIETELVVNAKRRGYAFTDTEVHADDDQATGFVIVQLNQGDVVYVRSTGSPQGTFQHAYHGQWTFSGWKIA